MQAVILEALPAAILVGAEVFAVGFTLSWAALAGFVDRPVWLAIALAGGGLAGAIAAIVLVRQALATDAARSGKNDAT
ncbi:MAG: hypothetical protein GC152_04695 [Alphaproteobacteria bacterium]|nr:hypothetical protein [Alphaproteobacteria bacterium]